MDRASGTAAGAGKPRGGTRAPEQCLFYASWAGMAAADAKSRNQTEQLLAEPEVQRSFAALATLMSNSVLPNLLEMDNVPPGAVPVQPSLPGRTGGRGRDTAALRQIAMDFAKLVAVHPGAVFVTKIKTDKGAAIRDVRGGMLVAAGQDADQLRALFEEFRKQLKAAGTERRSRSRAMRGIVS